MLAKLLDEGLAYSPIYPPSNNSDHRPMTLCAMSKLGATDEQLQVFATDYERNLLPIEPDSDYARLFTRQRRRVQELGGPGAVADLLPTLLPSMAMEAFHPLIRLGYSLRFGCQDEVAAALAYWSMVQQPVPLVKDDMSALEVVLGKQSRINLKAQRFGPRIVELVEKGSYPAATCDDLDACARIAMGLYQATRNFFTLHLVTATQALRVCTEMLDDKALTENAASALSSAILAAHLVLDAPTVNLTAVLRAPRTLDPEHAIKYVYSCLDEYHRCGRNLYLQEARAFRSAGLVPDWVKLPD